MCTFLSNWEEKGGSEEGEIGQVRTEIGERERLEGQKGKVWEKEREIERDKYLHEVNWSGKFRRG